MPCFTTRRTLQPHGLSARCWGRFTFTAVILSHAAAWAVPISSWTFETSPPASATDKSDYPNPISADAGLGSAGGHHSDGATDWSAPVGNGTGASFQASFWNAGDYFQFAAPTTGYTDIGVSFDIARSSTSAPGYFELQYSTTGSGGLFSVGLDDFAVLTNDAGGLPTRTAWNDTTYQSAYSFSVDLSSLSALNENATVVFRLIAVGGASSTSAAVHVDNFLVSGIAVPEPASLGMLLFGGAWVLFRRRRKP